MKKATFGAGCFWGVEAAFARIKGVTKTTVGYSGGKTTNPTYKDVCSDSTGHAEVIEIEFDPAQVSYNDLLEVFFELHDPTQMNRQGPDVGTQYRSVVFYHDQEQKQAAEAAKAKRQASGKYNKPVVTEISPAAEFYPAEEYHQKYLEKNGFPSCHT